MLPHSSAPPPPSNVSVSQNGPSSILVSWKPPPPGGPAVTGYVIYCKNNELQNLSVSANATATSAAIDGLITGEDYCVAMVAISSVSSSTETTATITILEGV